MVRARFLFNGGLIQGFKVTDHAGLADAGRDIACASVTSAVQMASNTITEVVGITAEIKTDEARVYLTLPNELNENEQNCAQAVLNGMRLHFNLLAEEFPGTISVEDMEV
jgi:uncharacterized protein YsxB (DUF464 family)